MLTKVELPQGYKRLINKEKERKDVIQIIDDEGFLREISFDELTSHPTTISGYGITDAYTKAEVDSLFVTPDMITSFVNDADYNSTTKEIELKHGSTVVATVDATAFIKDGMVSSVTVENGYIVIEFNTDAGHEAIRIPITDIFDSNNYYTKAESDARYITEHQSLAGYTPKVEAIPYIEGPTTDTTAGHWTGTYDGITALEEGLTIIYVPHIAGASTTTLNINGLGAKTCYWTGTSKMTTQYPVGSPILLTYSNNGWRRSDSNTTYSAGTKALFDAGANTSNRVWSAKVLADSVAPIVHTHAWSDITDAPAFITAEALDGYATEQWVQNQGYLTEHQSLANYYTKTEADNLFLTEHQDLSEYAKLTDIPTALSQLSEDATHRLVTDTEKSTWSAKQDAISDLSTIRTNASHGNTAYNWGNHAEAGYAMATDIPENVSELTNDAGYITSADVPTSLAELSSDSTHRLVTDAEKTTWNNKQNAISDLADIRSGAALGATALQSETDPIFSASPSAGITSEDIDNWNAKQAAISDLATIRTRSNEGHTAYGWGNHAEAGYLTSFTETDPIFSASPAHGITTTNITNWNTAFSWGNHASEGYLKSVSFADLTSHPTTLSGYGITDAKIQNGIITLGGNTITPLTSFTETDPTVPSWAKASTKPSYTLDEVTDGNTRKLSKYVEKIQGTGTAVYYYNSVLNWSGVLLTLPFTWSPVMSGMFSFTIRTYIGYVYTDFVVSGYDYGSSHWYLPDVKIIGGESKYIFKFGWFDTTGPSGGKHLYVWFGRGQDSGGNDLKFGYGGFSIINVHCGHFSYDVYKNWSAENMSLSSLTNVQATITPSKPLLDNITLDNVADGSTRKLSNYVPTTRTINSKALSSNITLTLDDVSDGSTRKLYKTITIQSATEGQYTKETLATLFGVSSSDLSLILDGECYIDYSGVKYSPATARKWDDSSLSVTEYSVVDRDWDLEKWYLNDITILGYGGAIALIVKTRVYIATEEAAAHMSFTTYSELVTLKNNGGLVPGKWYGINDYEATTTDTESRSNGHKFGILVLATSSDTLSEECLAYRSTDSYYSGSNLLAWKVWYTVDNDTTRFSWADETNGKGVIYRLIDEWGNDLPYDFKSIQFKRYKVTAASANPELQVLNGLYLGLQSNSKGLTTDTSNYKWFYTFSQLGSDWTTDATDASLKLVSAKVVARTVFGPKVTSNEVTQVLNNIVMMNGALVQTFLEAHGTQSDYEDSVSTDFLGGSSKVNDITTFGNFGNVNVTGCFRWNIFVGTTRHLDFKTDCQNNTVACFDDFCFNTFDDGFNNNVIVTTEAITQNRFGEYFQNNVINIIGYIKQNEFGPTFYNNKIYCSIVNNTFGPSVHDNTFGTLGEARSNYIQRNVFGPTVYHCSFKSFFMLNRIYGQITYCNFGSYVAANTIDPILQYVDIPDGTSSTMFRGAHIHGGIRGTSTAHIALDSSEFRGSVSGVTRAIDIEGDADGKIVATWYSNQKRVGIYKAVADTSWTALPDEIGDINTILSSI